MPTANVSEDVVLVERDGPVAILTLNRPDAMNALSRALREALSSAFRDLAADADVRVAVVTGAGRAFCAGFDLKELSEASGDAAETASNDLPEAMGAFAGPIIAAVNGHAITGGFELALACDVLIASTQARFADTHARVGILPGWGLSQKLPRLIGESRAKEISFTGNFVDAQQACDWGLVNRVVEPEALLAHCRELAHAMASCVPGVLEGYKSLIDRGLGMSLDDALAMESEAAIESARQASAAMLATRRDGVQQRGRAEDERKDRD
jgi:enoyl-CoA hydratase